MKSRYIDSTGNEISRSTYEAFLAMDILKHDVFWRDFFDKLNKSIVDVIKYNKNNTPFMDELNGCLKKLNAVYPETSLDKLIDTLSTPIADKKDDYPNRFGFNTYKYFFERALPSAWIIPESHLLKDEKESDRHKPTYYAATVGKTDTARPTQLFSYHGRGRIGFAGAPTTTQHAGILSQGGTPKELKNKFQPPVPAGRLPYKRIPGSPTVQFFEEHDLPFGAGPSGTIGFTLNGVNALLNKETNTLDYKKFYMALTAYLVYEGHHSFADVGIVINAIKETEPSAFQINPKLKAKEYYDQYLALEYRVSNEYNLFVTKHNIAKYSAITWEILKDALEEQEKTPTTSQKSAELFYQDLKNFIEEHKKSDELTPSELDQLKILLKKHYPKPVEKKELKSNEKPQVITKLVNKLVESGILIHPQSIIDWPTIHHLLRGLTNDEKNDPTLSELFTFNLNNAHKQSELSDHYLAQLLKILVKANTQKTQNNATLNQILSGFNKKLAHAGINLDDLNAKDSQGLTPIIHSVLQNHKELTKALLECKVDPSATTKEGYSLLHLACLQDNASLLNCVLPYSKINNKSTYGETPLLLAIQKNHTTHVLQLLKMHADVNIANSQGETPLSVAAKNGNASLVATLLEHKADPTARLNNDTSILWIALKNGHKNVAKQLIAAGVNIEQPNNKELTMLWEAVENRHEALVNSLLELKANPNVVNKNTQQSLFQFSINHWSDTITEKLAKVINVHQQDAQGNSPLILATLHEKITLIKDLIDAKADISSPNKEGTTALHIAAAKLNTNIIDIFLNKGISINITNQQGETPLMLMVQQKPDYYTHHKENLIKKMLENKADPNLKDKKGLTALQHAVLSDDPSLASLLIAHKANINQSDTSGNTPLHVAAEKGYLDCVKFLIEKGADISAQRTDGKTPLQTTSFNRVSSYIEDISNQTTEENQQNSGKSPQRGLFATEPKIIKKTDKEISPETKKTLG